MDWLVEIDSLTFEPERQEVCGSSRSDAQENRRGWQADVFDRFSKSCQPSHRLLHDVLVWRTSQEYQDQFGQLNRKRSTRGFHLGAAHKETENGDTGHWHLIHSCAWNGSHCQCGKYRGLSFKPRSGRPVKYVRDYSYNDLASTLNYCNTDPRSLAYIEIGGENYWSVLDGAERLEAPGATTTNTEEGLVEACGISCQEYGEPTGSTNRGKRKFQSFKSAHGSSIQGAAGGGGLLQLSKNKINAITLVRQIADLIADHCVVPLASTCDIPVWKQDPVLRMFGRNDPTYKDAVCVAMRQFDNLTYDEMVRFYIGKSPWWQARQSDHYLDLQTSYDAVLELLKYQYGTWDKVKGFIKRLFDICEKRIPKRNTMIVISPPNGGKTWFFDAVTAWYLNIGNVGNFVKNNAFPLNDCVNRRILYWNEPCFTHSNNDTLKMLTGGDQIPAAVKHQSGHVIPRTPLLMTSNKNVLNKNADEYKPRVYWEHWASAPLLKNYVKPPSPAVYHYLIQEFVINDGINFDSE